MVEHNAGLAMGTTLPYGNSRMETVGPGHIRVTNRELLIAVSGTAVAGVIPERVFAVPLGVGGTGTTTTWLNKFSTLYDKYLFSRVRYVYEPIVPTTTTGAYTMFFDSEASDVDGLTFVSTSGNYRSVSGPIWSKIPMDVAKPMLQTQKMFSTGTKPNGVLDSAFFVCGAMVFATTPVVLLNNAAAGVTTVGYVWVEYVVDLMFPTNN